MDPNRVCAGCKKAITLKDKACLAENDTWHERCFVCSVCKVSLLHAGGFYQTSSGYMCPTHYQSGAAAACAICRKPVLDQVLKTMDKDYHVDCFRCLKCKRLMNGIPFLPVEDSIFCKKCWHTDFGETCHRCAKKILPVGDEDPEYMQVNDWMYHMECYTCADCGVEFTDDETAYNVGNCLCCKTHATERQMASRSRQSSRPTSTEIPASAAPDMTRPPTKANTYVGEYALPKHAEDADIGNYDLPSSRAPAAPASPAFRRRYSVSVDASGYSVINKMAATEPMDDDLYSLPQTLTTLSLKHKPIVQQDEGLYAQPQDAIREQHK